MNREDLAAKVRVLRKRKGFTQEQLAEESMLSLRTVQRIEKGETVPHGDSLRKLTAALSVTPDDILEWAPVDDKGYLTVLHLTGLALIFHPMLGIIMPLLVWILKKDKIILVNDSGKKLLNYQLTFALVLYTLTFILNKGSYITFDISAINILANLISIFTIEALVITLLYLYSTGLIFFNVMRTRKGLKSSYFLSIPFLR
ncbi:helix-turn-helix domain-containing protein [Pontibacter burrus]|uniref:Helix-turn-helix domain-containing protein n=1 Tax=Pontibacter burrus TaxID=2704466 RepID=A0A6B3LKR9_9BACT|nr:helix-turn-helix domain-containing protein [Pontibacter burrus]NEM97369.1 helix-turn-helix domain-containing protein [Pontibacter burrus]